MRTVMSRAAAASPSGRGSFAFFGVLTVVASACGGDWAADDDSQVGTPVPSSTATTTRTSALSAVGRLYLKYNGKIAIGVDTDGNLFSPTVELSNTGGTPFTAFPGIVFKQNGTALY